VLMLEVFSFLDTRISSAILGVLRPPEGMSQTKKLLRELIALPSVNPAFLSAQHPRAGEQRVGQFLGRLAVKAGLDVEFQPVLDDRSNLVARLAPRRKARCRVLLAPHLDTVNAEEGQFTPRERNGKIFGRGACDTKGSIAAMMGALFNLARNGKRPQETELVFVGLVDEENAQAGSRALVRAKLKADLAIVGEPTELRVVTAHKGSLWLKLETRGKAAHGSRPELGVNAVHAMARVVDILETDYAKELTRRQHPVLGRPTINVGAISGGTQPNIVPDYCSILIDRRTLPGEEEKTITRAIQSRLKSQGLMAAFCNLRATAWLPLETDPKLPLVARFLSSVRQARPAGVNYFSDASVLSHGGIPSVLFGPGDIAQAHTTDEWLETRSLERAEAMLRQFLLSLP
jgi:acetylornithine deacetylase/succinyl-diaminopimelate desuccinylase-like protein